MPYKNVEDRIKNSRNYYLANKDEKIRTAKEYYWNNKELISQRRKERINYKEEYWKNRDKCLGHKKKYDKSEKGRRHRRHYETNRYKNDSNFRKIKSIRDKARIIVVDKCSVCGSTEKLERHHEDYSKPLDVIILCKKHHLEKHGKVLYDILC